jgi:hypothetical protein
MEYLTETVEREDSLKLGPLREEGSKPPIVEAVHTPAVPDVPIDVQLRREPYAKTDAVKEIRMPPFGVQIAEGIYTSAHGEPPLREIGFVAAFVLPKESPPALNFGLVRSNDCLEGLIHG